MTNTTHKNPKISSARPACSAETEIADMHEMLAQMCCDNGDQEMGTQHMAVANTIRKLVIGLVDANDLCRSAMQIANRERKRLAFQPHQQEHATNWDTFKYCLRESLERQHRIMYPPNTQAEPRPGEQPKL